jgi:hypothetical protein
MRRPGCLYERRQQPHAEYNEAVARGLRISILTTSADQDGRQRDFLD